MQIHCPESLERVHGISASSAPRKSLIARIIAWHRARAKHIAAVNKALNQYDELLRMPNYMLADIGLTRDIVRQERTRLLYTGILEAPDIKPRAPR